MTCVYGLLAPLFFCFSEQLVEMDFVCFNSSSFVLRPQILGLQKKEDL
uniref:Uncharacterized protein n=1 Tax=Arundo donax TaxID=35708 RepID=A0A0A8YZV0_ARUDO